MPPVPRRSGASLTTSMPPSQGVNLGVRDLQRPATSPTRRGRRGRPAPHFHPLYGDAVTTPAEAGRSVKPVRGAAINDITSLSARNFPHPPPCRAESSVSASGRPPAAPPLSHHGGAAQLLTRWDGNGSAAAVPSAASPCLHGREGCPSSTTECSTSSSISFIEDRVRCLVHTVSAASLLPTPLQRILVDVLRTLQQERAQLRGQRPCRRHSRSLGTDMGAGVTECMVDAAQAPSPAVAAGIFSAFLTAHPADGSALLSSPILLVGTALAELVALGQIASCAIPEPQLLSFLDVAISVGHPGAMHSVAVCLRDGTVGLQRDAASSETWLRCASSAGYLPAMHELGETYERDAPASSKLLVEAAEDGADWGEAMRWYRQAAEAGYPPSQLNLGKLFLVAAEHAQSEGSAAAPQVAHLLTEAKRWLHACAATGVEEAVRLMGRIEG
ncbi:hypothetical protein Q4I30_001330 [Leishmania utingensis]|uniref:Sel1 repeat family protein n=2 Tax=Viannia TaxID=37616 RepID=A0AAW3AYP8_9TRYP